MSSRPEHCSPTTANRESPGPDADIPRAAPDTTVSPLLETRIDVVIGNAPPNQPRVPSAVNDSPTSSTTAEVAEDAIVEESCATTTDGVAHSDENTGSGNSGPARGEPSNTVVFMPWWRATVFRVSLVRMETVFNAALNRDIPGMRVLNLPARVVSYVRGPPIALRRAVYTPILAIVAIEYAVPQSSTVRTALRTYPWPVAYVVRSTSA